jgi:GNAT superfamily N-acetyltransferase
MASGGGRGPDGISIRPYRPADHSACRRLWGELVDHRGALYGSARTAPPRAGHDGRSGGGDAGAGFEEYLTRLELSGLWVADSPPDGVVGFIGLTLDGSTGCIDPVVVTRSRRGQGIGQALLSAVAEEARRRSLSQLTISPSARDQVALRSLHAAGFGSVSSVTLAYTLSRSEGTRRGHSPEPDAALDLYDLRFSS